MLEIVNGMSEYGVLKRSKLFKNENIIEMALLLNVGQIKNLENLETKVTCNETINVKEKIDKLRENLKRHNTVRIWFSSIDSEDYNFFLFIVYLINKINKDIKINIINVGTITQTENLRNVPRWSLGCFSPDEIKELLQFERTLKKEEIHYLLKKWMKLESENSDLRIIDNKKLKSVNYGFLDKTILEELFKYEEVDEIKLIVDLMIREIEKHDVGGINGEIIFRYRINELIKQNKIKIVRVEKIKNVIGKLEDRNILKIQINN